MNKNNGQKFADAAFRYALKNQVLASWSEVLNTCDTALEHKGLSTMLSSPFISTNDKVEALRTLIELSPQQSAWLRQVFDAKQVPFFNTILSAFNARYNAHLNKVIVNVFSRTPLTSAQQKKVIAGAETQLKKAVDVQFKTNPKLLGGIVIEYNGRVVDMSLNQILNQL